jgi:hypothetical protein
MQSPLPPGRTLRVRVLRRVADLAVPVTLAVATGPAFGHGKAHVHDVAEAQVAVDGDMLRIALATPLANVLGFERAPRNDAERDAVKRMAATLRDTAKLYVPNAEAKCTPAETTLTSTVLDPALLGGTPGSAPAAAPAAKPADDHGDLAAVTTFRCASIAALRSVEVRLMQTFPKLRRIDVQIAGPTRQSMMRLTGDRRTVSIK